MSVKQERKVILWLRHSILKGVEFLILTHTSLSVAE